MRTLYRLGGWKNLIPSLSKDEVFVSEAECRYALGGGFVSA